MKIPKNFKKAIKSVFYDKDIVLLKSVIVKDDEGGSKTEFKDGEEFKGNVNFTISQEIQEEYGLNQKIDVVITTDFEVPKDSYIKYEGVIYKINDNKARDSHYRLVGAKYGR